MARRKQHSNNASKTSEGTRYITYFYYYYYILSYYTVATYYRGEKLSGGVYMSSITSDRVTSLKEDVIFPFASVPSRENGRVVGAIDECGLVWWTRRGTMIDDDAEKRVGRYEIFPISSVVVNVRSIDGENIIRKKNASPLVFLI